MRPHTAMPDNRLSLTARGKPLVDTRFRTRAAARPGRWACRKTFQQITGCGDFGRLGHRGNCRLGKLAGFLAMQDWCDKVILPGLS